MQLNSTSLQAIRPCRAVDSSGVPPCEQLTSLQTPKPSSSSSATCSALIFSAGEPSRCTAYEMQPDFQYTYAPAPEQPVRTSNGQSTSERNSQVRVRQNAAASRDASR